MKELEAKSDPSYEVWDKSEREMINVMRRKKECDPAVKDEKIVVVFLGGAMGGAIGAGYAEALLEEWYDDSVISAAVTVSGGGGNGMYYVSKEPKKHRTYILKNVHQKNF